MLVEFNQDPPKMVRAFICKHTEGFESVLELGAGYLDMLDACHESVIYRCGIELFLPYITESQNERKCVAIHGDMRDWEMIYSGHRECVMMIDSLEHLGLEDGVRLILGLQRKFKRILVFTPYGYHPQDTDETGHDNVLQYHLSSWYDGQLFGLGFETQIAWDLHAKAKPEHPHALFGVWNA